MIVPQTNRIYRYQLANQQPAELNQYDANGSARSFEGKRRQNQQYYSQNQYNNNFQGQNNRNENPYMNNEEKVKLRRYQVHRPGIRKEFYDVEERVIVRPVGSALIELDPPTKKQYITNYRPNDNSYTSSNGPLNSQSFRSNNQIHHNPQTQNDQYFSNTDCLYGGQAPVYDHSPPATNFNSPGTQFHPTTFAPTTTTSTTAVYPTSVNIPSQTYQPSISDQSYSSTFLRKLIIIIKY